MPVRVPQAFATVTLLGSATVNRPTPDSAGAIAVATDIARSRRPSER